MRRRIHALIAGLLILLLPLGCVLSPLSNLFGMFGLIVLSEIDDNRPGNLTDRNEIIAVFRENEEAFLHAAETNSFEDLNSISGVSSVTIKENYVDIEFGGAGFGSSTSYFGISYSETDDICSFQLAPNEPVNLTPEGDGFKFQDQFGGNVFYSEPLGNHYFYYEAHF